ncbi:MAG: TetR/AcrR family transcriptional regulator [Anaerolineae bacterium]|nr:TetR/AcrR family transcriptional regulator [Anaerolineae bacterium]
MKNQQRSEETRTRILAAALDCFARYGYAASGVAEICQAAGVSKGAFYHHFAGKQALFQSLLGDWLTDLEQTLTRAASTANSVPERLTNMARMARLIFHSNSPQTSFLLEFWSQASRDAAVRQAIIAPYRRFQRYFADLIQQGVDEGTLQPVNALAAAQTLISLTSGLFLQHLVDPQGADWAQATEDAIHLLLHGLQKPEGGAP